MNINGKIIVIEGTDGSGKQTQARVLKEKLEKAGYNVYSTSFPNYESDSSAAVRMYLKGEICKSANDVSAKAASSFYAIDRYITYKKEIEELYLKKKHVLVFDRWVASNIIHQGAKLIANETDEAVKEKLLSKFITWLDNLEHSDLGVPKADITIYLNVPIEYTEELRKERLNKFTGKEKQDIHESDTNHLRNASMTGLVAAKLLNWNVIECVKDGSMRSVEDISEEIWQKIFSE